MSTVAQDLSKIESREYLFRFTESERRVFKKRDDLTVSEWANLYRIIHDGPLRGQWETENTAYLKEPMDTLNEPWVRKIYLCFAPQTGKSQVAFNFLLYVIDQDPGPAMYVMPDEKTARRISRRRLLPMIKNTPRIRDLISPRSDDTTTLAVQFKNGMDLMMAWATSAAELSSESVRYLVLDETDKFPDFSGKEADPAGLAEIRTNAYPHTKKIIYISTPTIESGLIHQMMTHDADEIRDYHVPCPICGHFQKMEFKNITWPKSIAEPRELIRSRKASYLCEKCGMKWNNHMKNKAVRSGIWKPRVKVARPQAVGFHLPSWYSPFISLSDVAAAHLRGESDPNKKMFFVTQHKAEPWVEIVQENDHREILKNRTEYPPGIVPPEALALDCGIDTQKNGFWFVVRAWAEDYTSWLIQYGFVTSFEDLETLIFKTRYKIHGHNDSMAIWRAAIDTGGGWDEEKQVSRTEEVYQWLKKIGGNTVFGTKGENIPRIQRVRIGKQGRDERGRPIPGSVQIRMIDTAQFKNIIQFRFQRKENESQRMFLHSQTGEDYARQVTAEKLTTDKRGRYYWKRMSKENHLLDCEVLAAACVDTAWTPSFEFHMNHLKWIRDHRKNVNSDGRDETGSRPVNGRINAGPHVSNPQEEYLLKTEGESEERRQTARERTLTRRYERPTWLER